MNRGGEDERCCCVREWQGKRVKSASGTSPSFKSKTESESRSEAAVKVEGVVRREITGALGGDGERDAIDAVGEAER